MSERLQKVLSKAGVASRRGAEQLITTGRVCVNGKKVTELGIKVEPEKDRITVDGKRLVEEKLVYILFHKPRGVVTTLADPQGRKTVIDFLQDIPQRIYPVGRLDYNTDGLLLLTNDGELAHALTHPSKEITKIYIAQVSGIAPEEKLDLLRAGIKLEDGMTAPAKIEIVEYDYERKLTVLRFTIHEGRNRQIRRMCEKIGFLVKQLRRTEFAFFTLAGLKRGQYHQLTMQEVEQLKQIAQKVIV